MAKDIYFSIFLISSNPSADDFSINGKSQCSSDKLEADDHEEKFQKRENLFEAAPFSSSFHSMGISRRSMRGRSGTDSAFQRD